MDRRIVFMGTPDFAVPSLKALLEEGYDIVGVVTAPDKPAGRGRKLKQSAVKQFAAEQGLNILQPERLKSETFLEELRSLAPQLQVVVAFRMLPKEVWQLPPLGTLNLHASLLPDYRGAAPINHAIMNGEQKTGVTTFLLKHEIDTGDILEQEEVEIGNEETAGELHDKLMETGAEVLLNTVNGIFEGTLSPTPQQESTPPKQAPKIQKEDCRIDWSAETTKTHNKIRGLSPYPGAWTELHRADGESAILKIFRSKKTLKTPEGEPGSIIYPSRNSLLIATKDGYIEPEEIQPAGKGRMSIQEFLNGYPVTENWYCR